MGHLLTTDSIGPAMGGTTALLALLGGVWFPITGGSAMHAIAEALPSYWLVQASHVGLGGQGWGTKGWAVVAALERGRRLRRHRAYKRDTRRAVARFAMPQSTVANLEAFQPLPACVLAIESDPVMGAP